MLLTRGLYDAVGLTAYRSVFLHLLLIGVPFRFGLLPTGWGRGWLVGLESAVLKEPCSMFHTEIDCNDAELFTLKDFGVRYILFYSLAWQVGLSMRTSTSVAVAFHKILLGTSVTMLLVLAYMQPELISGRKEPLDADFSFSWALYYCIASVLSYWTILVHPEVTTESMKWSIPANAIFYGGVINVFVVVASLQILLESPGVERYYRDDDQVTGAVRFSFVLGAAYTAMHSILLLRIRTFLAVHQLRSICRYKVLVNSILLPILWMPEMSPIIDVDKRITLVIRATLTLTYLNGFLWAGWAEGVSRILTSEKED